MLNANKKRVEKMKPMSKLLIIMVSCCPSVVLALGQTPYVNPLPGRSGFPVAQGQRMATLCVDEQDHAGVVRAVKDLQADIQRVTGRRPAMTHKAADLKATAIIVGTIGNSSLIDQLIHKQQIDAKEIAGQWESFLIEVVTEPLPGVPSALVIVGSDKRGTIYGVYDLCEQIGVSPWAWWADVPARRREVLMVRPGRYVQGPPKVKYRGIFLNEKFSAGTIRQVE